jgi:hypothetical protein
LNDCRFNIKHPVSNKQHGSILLTDTPQVDDALIQGILEFGIGISKRYHDRLQDVTMSGIKLGEELNTSVSSSLISFKVFTQLHRHLQLAL